MHVPPTTALVLALFTQACGGGALEAPATEGGEGGEAPPDSFDPSKAWADRTIEERKQYMAKVVLPQMKEIFQRFDAEEFSTVECATCHGANMQEVGFRMPNTLHPLDPNAMPTADNADPEVARWARFMGGEVLPKMAELLGQQPYDPATSRGFGCFGCHAMVQ